jgi:hypothetical protein
MVLEEWWGMTPMQLVDLRRSLSAGVPEAYALDRIIEFKIAESDAKGNANLVASTDKLVAATQRLGTVTVWLVAGTLLMGLAAVADAVLKLKGVL